MTSREAYVLLNLLPGIGAKRTTLSRFPGIGPKLADVIVNWQQHADLD